MSLRRAEWALAILATLLLVFLHAVFFTHAGGLWRDEANTIGVATLPKFGEFLHWLDISKSLSPQATPSAWALQL